MTWWQYLMLVNIYLLLFYIFYGLLLSKETFFQLNRIYLVAAALLSFFIPLIQSDWVKNLFITQKVQYTIYSSPVILYRFQPIEHTQLTVGQVLAFLYIAGVVVLLARLAWQLMILRKVINQPQAAAAFSFFKKVNLGDDLAGRDVIAAHEYAHAGQWHSADVLIIEAIAIVNWFNPIVYLYRFAIKHVHEFIADRQALTSGTSKADYALLLLSQTFHSPAHSLVNPFFTKSLLKQRIMMLQKNRSQRVALFKYCLSAPLFILMLILSSATVNNSNTLRIINKKARQVFLTPAEHALVIRENSPGIKVDPPAVALADKRKDAKNTITLTLRDTTPKKSDKVFTAVEQVPEFPGGIKSFGDFLAKNIKYPAEARRNNVQGRVIISFVVETDGSLSNFRVARGVGYGTDEEAIRVLALSPKWVPGIQNGKAVRVAYSVPIAFTLADDKPGLKKDDKTGAPALDNVPAYTQDGSGSDSLKKPVTLNLAGIGNNPLVIIDGLQTDFKTGLASLNPNDIESISVLKDKSATALYGPKGANGVIVVATKKYKTNPVRLAPQTGSRHKQ